MTKIVGIIQPFDNYQSLYVYEDGNKKGSVICNLKDIENSIINAVEKYNATEVDLHGSSQFNRGLAAKIERIRAKEYSNLQFKINIA